MRRLKGYDLNTMTPGKTVNKSSFMLKKQLVLSFRYLPPTVYTVQELILDWGFYTITVYLYIFYEVASYSPQELDRHASTGLIKTIVLMKHLQQCPDKWLSSTERDHFYLAMEDLVMSSVEMTRIWGHLWSTSHPFPRLNTTQVTG